MSQSNVNHRGSVSYVVSSIPLALGLIACATDHDDYAILRLSGGKTTTHVRSPGVFEAVAPNLSPDEKTRHFKGDSAFETIFQPPPAKLNAGLGTQFNHTACASCHVRNGRGAPEFQPAGEGSAMLVRVSLDGRDSLTGGPVPFAELGEQLQDHAVSGVEPEAKVTLEWQYEAGAYADGTPYELRRPKFDIRVAGGAPLPPHVMTSPRIAPAVFGLGLLEAVSDSTLYAWSDPDDADRDGISGRVNVVWDIESSQPRVGRFGWKANTPSLLQQAAGAYAADMGVSNRLHPDPDGTQDLDNDTLALTTFYTQTLAVPVRAALSERGKLGSRLFVETGCGDCHRSQLQTGDHPIVALSDQMIAPYTDLLLHDLGEKLADHRPDFEATGREWRTAPLWGTGLVEAALGEGAYLHDGRARTVEEAILWHGGEAETAKLAFERLSRDDRESLVEFLKAL